MLATGFMPQLPKRPRQPSRPVATALSMSSARVDWEPPFDPGDGEILGYRVEKRSGAYPMPARGVVCVTPIAGLMLGTQVGTRCSGS